MSLNAASLRLCWDRVEPRIVKIFSRSLRPSFDENGYARSPKRGEFEPADEYLRRLFAPVLDDQRPLAELMLGRQWHRVRFGLDLGRPKGSHLVAHLNGKELVDESGACLVQFCLGHMWLRCLARAYTFCVLGEPELVDLMEAAGWTVVERSPGCVTVVCPYCWSKQQAHSKTSDLEVRDADLAWAIPLTL